MIREHVLPLTASLPSELRGGQQKGQGDQEYVISEKRQGNTSFPIRGRQYHMKGFVEQCIVCYCECSGTPEKQIRLADTSGLDW